MEHIKAYYLVEIRSKKIKKIMNNLKNAVIKYYDDIAGIYNIKHGVDLYGCEWGINKYYLPLIQHFVNKNSEILEIGCGTGKYTGILKKNAKRICGIDISPKMIDVAKKSNSDVRFIVGDSEKLLDFKNEEFDVVAGFNTFSYYPNKLDALHSINRVLKRGGIFFDLDMNGLCPIYYILSLIGINEMKNWYRYIKESTIKNLLSVFNEAGFDIVYTNALNWIPNALNRNAVLMLAPMNSILSNLPLIRKFAMRIVIVGRKR